MSRRMKRRIHPPQRPAIPPLLGAVTVYGVLFYFLMMASWLGLDDGGASKAFLKSPMLGPLSVMHVLHAAHVAWIVLLTIWTWRAWRRQTLPRWKILAPPITALALLTSVIICTLTVEGVLDRYDNDPIKTDQDMLAHFVERTEAFAAFKKTLREDLDAEPHEGSLIGVERFAVMARRGWREYDQSQRAVGIRRDITASHAGRRIWFFDAVRAIGASGTFKGYLYAEQPPAPLVPSLDVYADYATPTEAYRRIEGNWYLFLRNRR